MAFVAFWQPMRRKLPLLMTTLLFVAIGVLSWLAYRQLARALIVSAQERVLRVSTRLAAEFSQADDRLKVDQRRLHADSSFIQFFTRRDARSEQRAREALEQYRQTSNQVVAVELWNRRGQMVLASTTPDYRRNQLDAAPVTAGFASHGLIGPFIGRGDTAYTEIRLPVIRQNGDTLGIVRQYQRLNDGQGGALVRNLIGSDAVLLLGNVTGDVWTDMSRRVPAPPGSHATGGAEEATAADGTRWVAATAAAGRVPWLVWVALPREAVLAPARALLRDIAIVAAIILGLGGFAAWLLSRSLTRPLADVTAAAESIASGDYSRRVSATRHDELGRLATSFNLMTSHIEAATHDLEAQQMELELGNQELAEAVDRADRTTAQLASERKFLRQILDTNPHFVFAKDREGRFTLVNHAVAQAYGTSAEALIGKTDADFNSNAAEVEAFRLADIAVIDSGKTRVIPEERITDASGKVRWLHTVKRPIVGEDGRVDQLLGVSTDITERKQLEAQLLQSQKMEAVGQLAGGVAHDFNNMLTAIKGFSELVALELGEDHPARGDVAEITAAADRAAALTHQLLAFSRRQLLQPVVLSPNSVVEGVSKLLVRLIGAEVRCETRLAGDLAPVLADPGQLEQVLVNLAVNARDAMPNGGTLTIETANVSLDDEHASRLSGVEYITPGEYVMIAVSDTGTGMSRAIQERIFEPFFTTKEQGHGTGLGLSTVYGIVRQSGGYVSVYSELDQGTTIKVYLPSAAGEIPVRPARTPRTARHAASETILVVDDDASVRTAVARILTRSGYAVLTAASPREAEVVWTRHPGPIHLLMTDVMMPDMDGGQLALRLLRSRPEARVLYTSGYTDETAIARGLITPGAIFLAKPFTLDAVDVKVRQALAV